MLVLKALSMVLLAGLAAYAIWYLTSAFAFFYLLAGSFHPHPGPLYGLARKLFSSLADDVETSRGDDSFESAGVIMRRAWWPLQIVLLVLMALAVAVVSYILSGGA